MNKQKRLQKTILWIVVGIVSVLLLTYLVFVWFFQSQQGNPYENDPYR